jgi:CMP-N-acetylneuraminic acid synthetase
MKVAVEIPIKGRTSTRVPNKNFRDLCGKPLACWVLDELEQAVPAEFDIFIDSEDQDKVSFILERYPSFKYHRRNDWYAQDEANGNHLLNQFAIRNPDYDVYVQLHVTAVTLTGEIIQESMQKFLNSLDKHDSMLLVTKEHGWFWHNETPLNYRPHEADGLPRSQDAPILKETTGLYAITRDAVFRTGCRIGRCPMFYEVESRYSLDVDTMDDFVAAERLLSRA